MKTQHLFINIDNKWSEIDLYNDIEIPITLKVNDIALGAKSSSYSLDFDIPDTTNNNLVFGMAEMIDTYRGSFEVAKDYEAYLTDNCFTIFQGNFRLKKIVKTPTSMHYVGYLYGGTKNFIDILGTSTLTGNDNPALDLNFDEYNTPAEDMRLADFVDRLQSHFTDGEDWALTLIDKDNKHAQPFSSNAQSWYTDECTPYLGAMGIFNRIISGTGYQYVSKFLQGTDGNTYLQDPRWADTIGKFDVYSMIYPYMKHNSNIQVINPASNSVFQIDANANTDLVSRDYYQSYDFDEFIILNGSNNSYTCSFDNALYGIQNSGGSSSTLANWQFVAPSYGTYKINIQLPFYLRMRMWNDYTGTWYSGTVENAQSMKWEWQVRIMKNGSTLSLVNGGENYPATFTVQSDGYIHLTEEQSIDYSGDLTLRPGDRIQIYAYINLQMARSDWNPVTQQWVRTYAFFTDELIPHTLAPRKVAVHAITSDDDNIISITQQDGFYEENPFYPNAILNPNTTKLEFFQAFVKMFNLYVEDVSGKPNPDGGIYPDKCLRIEPYECYYDVNQSNTVDFTDKIDWNNVEYGRVEDYLYSTQKFSFEQNNDYFNDEYNTTYIQKYGCRDVKGVYCTTDEENAIQAKLGGYCCGLVNNSTDTIQCPKAFTLNKSDSVDKKKEYKDGIMFLWRNQTQSNTQSGVNYNVKIQSRLSSSSTTINDYYCADVANNGYGNDTATILFASPQDRELKNDLYSAFYKNQYEEFVSPDAMTMRAKIYLTAMDIATLKLSDRIVIDGRAWRILCISQWANAKTPCAIELIKI